MIIDELFEAPQQCPECGGISFSDLILAEKKDACYHKVKASAKVWPSAYASGRLVQCRKKGAANYGNKSEGVAEGVLDEAVGMMIKGAAISGPDDQDIADRIAARTGGRVDSGSRGHHILIIYPTTQHRAMAAAKIRKMFPGIELYKSGGNRNAIDEGMKADELSQYCEELVAEKGWDQAYKHARFMAQGSTDPSWGSVLKYLKSMKDGVAEEWSQKYKSSINCANPKGFSQKAHCAGRNKNEDVAETRRGQVPMTLKPGETDNIEPEDSESFKKLPAYKQGQQAQQSRGKDLIQQSPYTYQSDQDWAYRNGAFDARQAAASANFAKRGPLTTAEGEQQKGADYRDPKEVDYDDEYDAMVARVKKLAGLGPMRTVYDPNKRQYRNMPTAVQPKK
jgi:hypothetical protein